MSPNNFTLVHLVKIEWLVANVIAVESHDRAGHAILRVIVAAFVLGQSRSFLWLLSLLWCRKPLLSPNDFIYGHLVKIEWLVADVTAVGSLDRHKRAILLVILAWRVYGQSRSFLWSGGLFVM